MYWPHAIPGNGVVKDTDGLDHVPAAAAIRERALTQTFRPRSGQTSWGTHNMVSVSTHGGSTSASTRRSAASSRSFSPRQPDGGRRGEDRDAAHPTRGRAARSRPPRTSTDGLHAPTAGRPSRAGTSSPATAASTSRAMQAIRRGRHPAGRLVRLAATGSRSTTRRYAQRSRSSATPRRAARERATAGRSSGRPAPSRPTPSSSVAGRRPAPRPSTARSATLDLSRIPRSFWAEALTALTRQDSSRPTSSTP